MKSNITTLLVLLACLHVPPVNAQQPYYQGVHPSVYGMPGQYAIPPQAIRPGQPMPMMRPEQLRAHGMPLQQPVPPLPAPPLPGTPLPGMSHGIAPVQFATQPAPIVSFAPQATPTRGTELGSGVASRTPHGSLLTATANMSPQPVPQGTEGSMGVSCDDACDSCGGLGDTCSCGGGFLGDLFRRHGCGLGLHQSSGGPARIWGGLEYLYWWNTNRTVPALATTSVTGTPSNEAGVIGQSGTSVLFGGDYGEDPESGLRGTLGFWFNSHQTFGIYARGFQLGGEDINFHAASNGDTILARPFFNIETGLEDSLVVAYPGASRGTIDILTENEVTGFEVLLRSMLYYGECNRIDFVGGYHHTEISDSVQAEHLLISESTSGTVPIGTRIATADTFRAKNEFDGGSIGLLSQGYDGRFTWNLLTKMSFGNTRERVSISGTSTTTVPNGGSATFNQGLLALDTNSGVYERDEFTIVPEIDISLSYAVFKSVEFSVGYSAIYWSHAVLAGEAIDRVINPTQINGSLIGQPRPTYTWNDDSFWVQGLTFGVNGRF